MRIPIAFLLAAVAMAQPPKTTQTPGVEEFHGTRIEESYRWLEDPDSVQTRQWVAQENRYTQEYLSKLSGRGEIKDRLAQLFLYDRYPGFTTEAGARAGYFTRGTRAFYLKQAGLQNQPVLYVRESGGDRILLDPNTLSKEGTAAVNTFSVSRDGNWLAYAVAKAGSDWIVWRIRDVASGQDLPDLLDWSKFSSAEWDARGEGFYYGRYPAPAPGSALQALNENYQLCYHKRGTPQSADRIVYQRSDQPRWSFGSAASEDGRYLVIDVRHGTSVERQLYYLDLSTPDARPAPLIGEFYASHHFLGNRGARFYVLTNYEASRYRVVEIDLARPERTNWRTVIAEGPDTIKQAQLVGETFVLNYLHDVAGRVRLAPRAGGPGRDVPLPANSSITLGEASANIFAVSGFTAPETVYECGAAVCRPMFTAKLPFEPARFETRQVFVISKDGTKIPMFVSHRKGLTLDGSNPTLLYGYGGFNVSVTPGFSTFATAWMERGGVYATVNLRGGGEYGEQWHQAGMKQNKQNVFDDFIASAEWLIAQKYTSSAKLAIRGGSNGGLLVGAVLNQRPELFGAAIPAVGVMDMLRFDRFTIGHAWTSDYGDPKNPEDFRVLVKYSPLHNIRQGAKYPATMVTTADHDDRVVPAHSFKYAAALQAAQGGSAPILIRIETAAGHGAGKPTSKRIEEDADILAFLLNALGAMPAESTYRVHIDQDRLAGAVDFSWMNQPLTAADRLTVQGGHFANTRGERIRLWGVNFAFGANFPETQDAPRIAKRLRRLGVNLVRLHHMDTSPDAGPNTARSLLTTATYPTLNPVSVARLRALLDALKAEGIYVNLNLHVGYKFTPERSVVHITDPRLVELQCDYARNVVDALKLKDDPVLAMVEINNESSVLFAWQAKQYDQSASLESAMALDRAYLNRMRDVIRGALGAGVPIAGTQVEFGGPLNYDTHAGLDYQDDHFYIDHYNFPHNPWDARDWRIRDGSGAGSGYLQYLNKAFAREQGRPYTVSEYNQPYPNRQAAELNPTFAAFAAHQDWDAVMHFAYEHGREWDRNGPSAFNLNGDFTKLAAFGQSAWLFRKEIVHAATTTVTVPMPPALRRQSTLERQQFNPARFFEKQGVDPNLAFVHKVEIGLEDGPKPAAGLSAPYVSDTRELSYDPARKLYVIDTAQAAGVFGFAGWEPVVSTRMTVRLGQNARGFCSVLLTSLDGRPLDASERMLLTNPGYTLGEDQKLVSYPDGQDWYTLASAPGSGKPSAPFSVVKSPTRMERVPLTLELRTQVPGLAVYPLDSAGQRLAPLRVMKTVGNRLFIDLGSDAPWFEIAVR